MKIEKIEDRIKRWKNLIGYIGWGMTTLWLILVLIEKFRKEV